MLQNGRSTGRVEKQNIPGGREMRPIYLKMTAFGSYAEETYIDFTKVSQGVFLITGDTGAGKTTIFDAITYALYGQTSGGRRDPAMMRSQYAAAGTKTSVELLFENRGQQYRILRCPEYERTSRRKNKDGQYSVTKEKAVLELYLPDQTLYVGTRQEINKKIVEILGVDVKQFTQLVMIAQGDFLKLLLAKSDERREIFSRIFDTGMYARIQEELKWRTRQMEGRLEDNRKACLREAEQIERPEEKEHTEKKERSEVREQKEEKKQPEGKKQPEWDALLRQMGKEPDMEQMLNHLERYIREDKERYSKAESALKESTQAVEEASRSYSLATEQMRIWKAMEDTQKSKEALEAKQEWWKSRKAFLEKSRNALAIQPYAAALDRSQAEVQELMVRQRNLEEWYRQHGQEVPLLAEQLKEMQQEQARIEETEAPKIVRLKQYLEHYEELEQQLEQFLSLQKKQQSARTAYEESRVRYLQASEAYERANHAYVSQQAGILAAKLEEGEPCPVCGSLHHPKKADLTGELWTKEQLEEWKRKRDKAEAEREAKQQSLLTATAQLERVQAVLQTLKQELVGEKNAGKDWKTLKTELTDWRKKTEKQVQELGRRQTEHKKVMENCRKKYEKALQEESRYQGQLKENTKNLKTREEALQQSRQQFLTALEKQGFADQEEYGLYRKNQSELDRMEQEIRTYEEKLTESRQRLAVYQTQLAGKEKPDMERLENLLTDAKARQSVAEKEVRQTYHILEKNQAAKRKLHTLQKERKELREQYEVLSNVSRTANGSLSGTVKMDFESYIQRRYFERMIGCANQHLMKMTAGQFYLKCRSLENMSMQGNVGLDLDVHYLLTGKTGDVKQLSGGESFMAALSLALGMSDVIAGTQGAVQMDTLFIDEGFGSLDENAREQAIRILQGLAGGKRLVGIISHVTELKEQMEQQLVVTKTAKGSKAVWKN